MQIKHFTKMKLFMVKSNQIRTEENATYNTIGI